MSTGFFDKLKSFFKPNPVNETKPPKSLSKKDLDNAFMRVAYFLQENKQYKKREDRKNIYVLRDPNDLSEKYVIGKFRNTWDFDYILPFCNTRNFIFVFQNCSNGVPVEEMLSFKNLGDVYFTDASGSEKNLLEEVFGTDYAKRVLQELKM